MAEVNAELYEFMRERETSLYTQEFHKNNTVFAFVRVDFTDIAEFVSVVGEESFIERGLQITLCSDDVCIEVNEFIEGDGHYLSSYKKCFSDHDWEHYEGQIKEMEAI
jgi:hypothetical protein